MVLDKGPVRKKSNFLLTGLWPKTMYLNPCLLFVLLFLGSILRKKEEITFSKWQLMPF